MKPLKFLFCGFRHSHVYTLYKQIALAPFAQIVGCIEPNAQARAAAAQALGAEFSPLPYRQWLQTDVDVVVIGNAYGLRGADVLAALRAGKHVLADKPLCTDLTQLEEIRRTALEKNLKIGCMLDLRDLPQVQAARRLLAEGSLGSVRSVAFNGQHCLDYDHRPQWYFEPGMHGGTINDLAIHGIDLVRRLTGQDFVQIDAARVWNAFAVKHPRFKDCAQFMARLQNGAGVLADVSYAAPNATPPLPCYWEFRFWCDKGMLTFSYPAKNALLYRKGEAEPTVLENAPTDDSYLEAFVQEIEQNTQAVTQGVLAATQTALELQRFADKEA